MDKIKSPKSPTAPVGDLPNTIITEEEVVDSLLLLQEPIVDYTYMPTPVPFREEEEVSPEPVLDFTPPKPRIKVTIPLNMRFSQPSQPSQSPGELSIASQVRRSERLRVSENNPFSPTSSVDGEGSTSSAALRRSSRIARASSGVASADPKMSKVAAIWKETFVDITSRKKPTTRTAMKKKANFVVRPPDLTPVVEAPKKKKGKMKTIPTLASRRSIPRSPVQEDELSDDDDKKPAAKPSNKNKKSAAKPIINQTSGVDSSDEEAADDEEEFYDPLQQMDSGVSKKKTETRWCIRGATYWFHGIRR